MSASQENLKVIWFEGEMLPNWAQLLDAAARLCPVSEEIRSWFSRFANSCGVDDGFTVKLNAEILKQALEQNREAITLQLQRMRGDGQGSRIFAAWESGASCLNAASSGLVKIIFLASCSRRRMITSLRVLSIKAVDLC